MSSPEGLERTQPQVIDVDEFKCVNCHACISACPVKYCNDGSGNYVRVDPDTCIGCGNCLKACLHQARHYVDDFARFMSDLRKAVPMVAIVAPSAAANFPDTYMNLVGWLQSQGVKAVFDVSFGAELAAKSLVEYIRKESPKLVIAQSCPAIVTYIQIDHPELLQYLAPVDSPMVHTMKMIRTHYPQFADCKIAAISPCVAKKREFVETGYGDYNVTFRSLDHHFEKSGIDLSAEPVGTFDSPLAERAVQFSTPGGLLRTAQRWMPELAESTRTIEGNPVVYQYLQKLPEAIANDHAPLLVDCLSCEFGCNAGPATLMREKSPDEIEYWIEKRRQEAQSHYESRRVQDGEPCAEDIKAILSAYSQDGLYARQYTNLESRNKIRIPDERSRWVILSQMHKYSEADLHNCTACGYLSCEGMATAIYNGKNKPENCHFYLAKEREISHREIVKREKRLRNILTTGVEGLISLDNDFVITEVNPALCLMLGMSPDQVIGRNLRELTDDAGRNELDRQYELRKAGNSSVYEISLFRQDRTLIDCLLSASPIRDERNRKIGSFAMVTDITERKRNEQALAASERKIRRILETTNQGFWLIDNNAATVEVNDAMCQILSRTRDQILGRRIYDFTDEENTSVFKENLARRARGESGSYEVSLRQPDGRLVPCHVSANPLVNEHGVMIGSFAMFTDITERKRAEEALRKAHDDLERRVQERTSELARANEELQVEIGERERAKAVSRESESRLRTIMDAIPAGVILVEVDKHTIVDVNPAGLAMFGAKRDEVVGKACHRFICPAEEGQCPVTDLSRTVHNADKVLVGANGEHRPILKTVVPITLDGRGYLLESFVDISERKRNETRLEAMLQFYTMKNRNIKEITHFALEHAVVITESKIGYLTFLNDDESVLTMYAWSNSAMAECAIVDKPVEYPVHTTGLWGEAVRQRKPIITNDYAAPNPYKKGTPPGHVKVVRHMNIPVFDGDKIVAVAGVGNKPVDYDEMDVRQLTLLMNGMWDLIRRKRAEEALRESGEKLQRLIELTSDWVWEADENLVYTYASDKVREILGYAPEEVIGKTPFDFMPVEEAERVAQPVRSALADRQPIVFFENMNLHKDGRKVILETSGVPVFDAQGSFRGYRGVDRDITNRKQAEEMLRKAKAEAEETNRHLEAAIERANTLALQAHCADSAKSEFLAVMSHEIRTPLSGVIGMLDILLKSQQTSDQRRYSEMARDNAGSLLAILDDILDFSKIEAGRLALEVIPFRPTEVFSQAVETFRVRAESKGLNLHCEIGASVPAVLVGDPTRLRQIISNLVGNAVKFTTRGRITITVRCDARGESEVLLQTEVQDTGIGITPEAQQHLFKSFQQANTSTTRKYGGTGLGLSICKSLVEMMGGTIGVESEPCCGSTFTFSIRLAIGTDEDLAKVAEAELPPEASAQHTERLHILCAEDSPTNQTVVRIMVQGMGHAIDLVDNGQKAIEALGARRYDAVLMDVRMPVTDGLEATQVIRNSTSSVTDHDVYIIALTANASKADRDRCLATGMNDYVSKPVKEAVLHAALARAIEFARNRGIPLAEEWDSLPVPASTAEVNTDSSSNLDESSLADLLGEELEPEADSDALVAQFSPDALREIVSQYLRDTPQRIEEMRTAMKSRDTETLARAAHTIKSSSKYVRAAQLSTLGARVETMADQGDLVGIETLVSQVERAFERIRSELLETGEVHPSGDNPT